MKKLEFKGTKGEWFGTENQGVISYDNEGNVIADVFEVGCGCCTSSDLNEYDAKLISAAPDLLEALQMVVFDAELRGIESKVIDKAKQAITKALS